MEIFNEKLKYTNKVLKNHDMLYIGGGNIENLLTFIRTTQTLKIIKFFYNSKK